MGAYDLTSVAKCLDFMGLSSTDIAEDGLSIYCSAGDATAATVEVTSDASSADLILVITGGAAAGTNTLDLTSDVHDTLTELVSVINGKTGWTAQLLGTGAAASSDLLVLAATGCLGTANEQTLRYSDRYLVGMLIEQATGIIENELGYHVLSRGYTDEIQSGTGSVWLYLDNPQISSVRQICDNHDTAMNIAYTGTAAARATVEVTSTGLTLRKSISGTASSDVLTFADYATITLLAAAVDALTGWETTTETGWASYESADLVRAGARDANIRWVALDVPEDCETDYEIYVAEGKLYNPSGWPCGNRNIVVDYTAGYSTTPAAIESACMELVKLMWDAKGKDLALKSEKLGDYAYTIADRMGAMFSATGGEALSNTVMMKLAPYMRTILWA